MRNVLIIFLVLIAFNAKSQYNVYGDQVVWGTGTFNKNISVADSAEITKVVTDTIKYADGTFSVTAVSFSRDSVYQYELDSGLVRFSDTTQIIATKRYADSVAASGGAVTDFSDADFTIFNSADATKILQFDASSISTGTTRTLSIPDENGTIATRDRVVNIVNDSSFVSINTDSLVSSVAIADTIKLQDQILRFYETEMIGTLLTSQIEYDEVSPQYKIKAHNTNEFWNISNSYIMGSQSNSPRIVNGLTQYTFKDHTDYGLRFHTYDPTHSLFLRADSVQFKITTAETDSVFITFDDEVSHTQVWFADSIKMNQNLILDTIVFGDGTKQSTSGGGAGTPGGNNTTVQFNNSGSFAGSDSITIVDDTLNVVTLEVKEILTTEADNAILLDKGQVADSLYDQYDSLRFGTFLLLYDADSVWIERNDTTSRLWP